MIKLKMETEKPRYCIAKDNGIYIVKHIVRGKKGIRALVDIKYPSKRSVIVVDEHPCPLAAKFLDSGCIILSAKVFEKKVVWDILCGKDAFLKLMDEINDDKSYRIIEKKNFLKKDNVEYNITYSEYVTLKKALDMGFFECPKKITLEELAKELGVSKSTLSNCIRRGLKKVLMQYFDMVD